VTVKEGLFSTNKWPPSPSKSSPLSLEDREKKGESFGMVKFLGNCHVRRISHVKCIAFLERRLSLSFSLPSVEIRPSQWDQSNLLL